LISKQDLESADMVFVMTKDQYDELTDKYSQFFNKIFLINDYCYKKQKDIPDPINKEGFLFNRATKSLKQTIEVLAEKLIANR
jgi:protein-tyrosine-phosphatase